MNTKNQMKPLARLIATSLAVGSMAGFGAQVFAQTAAGTLIKNLATVTYEDENGNEYSAQSNEAVVTVAPVYSAIIEKDNALSAAPGQTVYFPHVLSNTGNIEDTYTVSASDVLATNPDNSTSTLSDAVTVFDDLNANGQPDPGEPELTSLTVAAGEQKNIVVAVAVPVDALDAATYSSTLTATTPNATVIDESGNADESNVDTATVSTGPVLVLNKASVHDVSNQQITYTLTVKNNGGSDATNVNIIDALPTVDHDDDSATPDKQVRFVSASSSGLVNVNDIEGGEATVDENTAGDINNDGVLESLQAIVAKDVTLPPNTTVSVTYTVTYAKENPTDLEWAAGASVDNTFIAYDDPTSDNGNPDDSTTGVVSSNPTHDVIPSIYAVEATDTETDAENGNNNGGDDVMPTDVDDTQYVDVSPTGGEVKFKHIITNDGNGDDVFNLDAVSVDFPTNTVFTFWDSTGTVQLTDTDNDGVPDTGTLAQDESTTIMIKAKLPAGISGSDYDATLTATSSGDTSVKDVTQLKLGEITAPSVDIANAGLTGTGDQGMTGFNDNGIENAQNESPAKLVEAEVGGVAVFNLTLANESGSADSYLLSAANIPTGWDVKFKDAAGNVITTSPLIPGGETFEYTAEVTISSDPSEAMHDLPASDGGVDGYDASNDDTGTGLVSGVITPSTQDGDKDYQIDFSAASTSTSGLADTVTNTVDVMPNRDVVITPNGQNQIQPGGTVDYSHKIENNGNMDEPVTVSVTNSADGWTTLVKVDTNADGVPDSVLAPGVTTTLKGLQPDGSYVDIAVTYDTDGNALMTIPPGVDIAVISVVSAPSNAPLGSVDASTITVKDNKNDTVTAQDQTNVILGQVRLDKKAAIDTNCDGVPDLGTGAYSANQLTQVKPTECVVWRLTATNEGNADVNNVLISDAAPDYTTLQTTNTAGDDLLKVCFGNDASCDAEPLAVGTVGGVAAATGDIVTFKPSNVGATLQPGQKLTAEFTVKID